MLQPGADNRAFNPGRCSLFSGKSVSEISREIGVTENTYYRWRNEQDGKRQVRTCSHVEY
ncbi:MAG: transposase [Thermodesulfobacteriota bacterium]